MKEMFYSMTHSTHFIYGYMVSDIWLRTILIVRKETRCRHIDYSFRLTARVILNRRKQDSYPLKQNGCTNKETKRCCEFKSSTFAVYFTHVCNMTETDGQTE